MKLYKEEIGLLYLLVAEAMEKLNFNSYVNKQLITILYKLDQEARK